MEIGEPHRLLAQFVEVGRLEDGIPVAGEIAHALIVGEDDQDVGFLAPGGSREGRYRSQQERGD